MCPSSSLSKGRDPQSCNGNKHSSLSLPAAAFETEVMRHQSDVEQRAAADSGSRLFTTVVLTRGAARADALCHHMLPACRSAQTQPAWVWRDSSKERCPVINKQPPLFPIHWV
ncbi:hypothetical protein AAFF_G00112940 [Aldrovandia affinis]|uniref:Uncharacterized protein n=1 Tax=Aldrovandia affinis TaxID=143900 RepID=A0AAD7RTA2_9TELE|nr:hypothetical protein AAFF_G00112940 [Aldrovandia affinis]